MWGKKGKRCWCTFDSILSGKRVKHEVRAPYLEEYVENGH